MSDLGDGGSVDGPDEAPGVGSQDPTSTRFKLLVSAPDLGDDNFDQTVVLVMEHDSEGALGLVLNRPTSTEVGGAPARPHPADGQPAGVLHGRSRLGRRAARAGSARLGAETRNVAPIDGPLVMVDPEALVNGDVEGIDAVRLYTGLLGLVRRPARRGARPRVRGTSCEALPDDVLCVEPGGSVAFGDAPPGWAPRRARGSTRTTSARTEHRLALRVRQGLHGFAHVSRPTPAAHAAATIRRPCPVASSPVSRSTQPIALRMKNSFSSSIASA